MKPVLDPARDLVLRTLDPAPTTEPVDRERQAALLATVLATSTGAEAPSGLRPVHRRHGRRLVLASAAVGALTAAALVLPGLGNGYAYASWTPDPRPVGAADLALVRSACLDDFGSGPPTSGGTDGVVAKDLAVRLAERRGTWVGLLLTGNQSSTEWEVSCLAELPAGTTDVRHVSVAASGGGGFAPPRAHEFVPGGVAEFGVDTGLFGSGRRQPASVTSGRVGSDVAGVTVHSGATTVEASVEHGTYAAWWPSTAFTAPPSRQPDGQGGPTLTITYDLTLKDGTVLRDVQPTYR